MLQINGLSKSYLQRGVVLDHLELEVAENDTLAITGPSGSGKTTLLNLIALLDKPESGDIQFRNNSILAYNRDEAADYRNRNIGFVFQDHLLMPHLTISENIMLPLFAGRLSASIIKEKKLYGYELMDEVGISDLKNKFPFQVSGGEAQRASLVRALINKPSILLADEPTGALDSANAGILAGLLSRMNRTHGLSVIVATHSSSLADQMSRKMKLEKGKLIAF